MANKLTPRMVRLEFKWFQEMLTKRKRWLLKTWKRPQVITTTVDMAMVVMAMVITVMVIVMDMDMDMAIITMEDTITMVMVAMVATMADMDTTVVMDMEATIEKMFFYAKVVLVHYHCWPFSLEYISYAYDKEINIVAKSLVVTPSRLTISK